MGLIKHFSSHMSKDWAIRVGNHFKTNPPVRIIKRRKVIDSFSMENAFLSNFYTTNIYYMKRFWPSVEHAFQASKTFSFKKQEEIRNLPTCKLAKEYGNSLKLRSDWEEVKLDIMYEIVYRKYYDNQWEMRRLINTCGIRLVEGNTWHDNFWGHCMCSSCRSKYKHNYLGKISMRVRREMFKVMPVWLQDQIIKHNGIRYYIKHT